MAIKTSSTSAWEVELNLAINVARECGIIIRNARDKRMTGSVMAGPINTKMNTTDLVTETDVEVEQLVKRSLAQRFPEYAFVGEESYAAGEKTVLTDQPTWIVDPIDGTTNFVHGFPFVAVSIGLFVNKTPVVGVVYNPILDQLYYASKGCGAYVVDNARNTVDKTEEHAVRLPLVRQPLGPVNTSVVTCEWGSDRSGNNFEAKCACFRNLAADRADHGGMAHALRAIGSAALNTCLVATGQLDAYWEGGPWIWDIAAASCILTEAGGVLLDANPPKDTDVIVPISGHGFECRRYFAIRPSTNGYKDQKPFARDFYQYVTVPLQF
ncbi:inositol monophosphatase [Schizosaccharomyces japonicus yFS275]|uniref:Inositol-1-monophosphatase n=1 Tax=Schizosaccharomyces japonicus (strain yFS275 / FY16936) TaxID=402676 RepID=B6K2U1_SCHJY|nr:inositol monophosphatase [Schizosaccharomyces japonicus yFS275]EEB08581.1 inositol monophosphatase [Schizosaccharomyces japonicus yFS275]